MRSAVIVISLLMSSLALAGESVNGKNKTDHYKIIANTITIGSVTVAAKYTGEPMFEGTQISVKIKCSPGYKLNSKFNKPNEFGAYDYGAGGKLSEWNAAKNQLKIFHRTAKVDDKTDEPVIDQSLDMVIELADACLKR